jgi:hypothetical protein
VLAVWTVEYLYTYGPATSLAAAFLKYLGTPTAVSDLEAAQYTPCPANGTGRARMLCTQTGSLPALTTMIAKGFLSL